MKIVYQQRAIPRPSMRTQNFVQATWMKNIPAKALSTDSIPLSYFAESIPSRFSQFT